VHLPSTPTAAGRPHSWLFAAAKQPVMIVELAGGTVIEANPAAAALMGIERSRLIGSPFIQAFAEQSMSELSRSMASARRSGNAPRIGLRARGARGRRDLGVTLSLVRVERDSYLLVHLQGTAFEPHDSAGGAGSSIVLDVIEQAAEGFVVTDSGLRLTYANRAFIELAGLDSAQQLLGKSLAFWLDLSQPDLARLHAQMARREAVTGWKTMLRRSSLSTREVEVSAIAVPDGNEPCWGFRIGAIEPAPTAGAT